MVSPSYTVPSGLKVHIPVAESQTRHWATDPIPMAPSKHPTLTQSPILMSSREKSPVKLLPEVYLRRGDGQS